MTAFQLAERKARYGHRDWLVWQDEAGEWTTDRATLATVRTMANAVHRGRKAFLVHANCGTLAKVYSRLARTMLSNAKRGFMYQG